MQAHYKDNKFKFFSRNGNDFTVEFGASGQEINKFSKFLASSLELSKVFFCLDKFSFKIL